MNVGPGRGTEYYLPGPGAAAGLLDTQEIFDTESQMLQDIAAKESCVMTGRSGFHVFRDHPNHLSILIQASMPFRVERVMRKQHMSEDEARKTIERVDKMHENYVKAFTKTSRHDTRNYQLVISADGKTEDKIVDIIMNSME
jgi:cytidylate kinase